MTTNVNVESKFIFQNNPVYMESAIVTQSFRKMEKLVIINTQSVYATA